MVEVDARGYSCPEPLLMTMNAMKENAGEPLHVMVSSSVARDNILDHAKKEGREAAAERVGDDYEINIK